MFTDRGSNARGKDRTELQAAITAANPGDVMVLASLARLARSHHDLAAIIDTLQNHQITLKVAGQTLEQINAANMVAMSAPLRADLITEVIAEHHQYKTRRRDPRGAKPALPPMVWLQVRELFDAGQPRHELATLLGVSRPTIFRIANNPMHKEPLPLWTRPQADCQPLALARGCGCRRGDRATAHRRRLQPTLAGPFGAEECATRTRWPAALVALLTPPSTCYGRAAGYRAVVAAGGCRD